ncbi:LysE family transporter [Kitasatospora nipponensis]|uniref:LysE family transporter n=1 Tax=Kitasatospora nipponensis TaxID=258049 RepID=A0ABN1WRM6_9ACTN
MRAALLAGVLAGYGIAVPVGAVGGLLVALTARSSWRVAAAAALGVATADGLYAVAAVLGGTSAARLLAPASTVLHWTAFTVVTGLALRTAQQALRIHRERRPHPAPAPAAGPPATGPTPATAGLAASPRRAYLGLLGLTLLNPATIVYFAALVLGGQARSGPGPLAALAFCTAAVAASASWQLLLAAGGAVLGRILTGPGGRLGTALASSTLIAVLAVRLVL